MLKKLYSSIIKDGENTSRRRFIKSAACLAAIAAIPAGVTLVGKTSSFEEKIKTGLVEGETFYLDEPIVIDIDNVVIRNCCFIVRKPMRYAVTIRGDCTTITECFFDGGNMCEALLFFPEKDKLHDFRFQVSLR